MALPLPERRVVLVGMMGSGKSTIGRLLAEWTGWPYHDNDALLERAAGASARELLSTRGEGVLREAESKALALGLSLPAPCIVAVAAGTIVDAANRAQLTEALVVWLRARPETLARRARRARRATHRPWLDTDAARWMRTTLAQRAPLYESVADLILDTDGRRTTDIAHEVLGWLLGLGAYH